MKVISLVGARPQFIKESVVSQELEKRNIDEIVVHSGQHYDFNMSEIFFKALNIKEPSYNLNVRSKFHGEMTGKIMIDFEKIVIKEKPDMVIVYGDTNTTLAGAIIAAKLKIPVAHIEAGVRMKPKTMPEEINRVLTDRISSLLFTSSELCVENLRIENIKEGVHFVGDTMYDLYLKMERFFDKVELLKKYGLKENEYTLVTIHRDYNTDERKILKTIVDNLNSLNKELKVVFPMHPRTKNKIKQFDLKTEFQIIEPLGYQELQTLVRKSKFIITDSGGLQKESYFGRKRAVVVMPDTGWRELTEKGYNLLSSPENILKMASKTDKKVEYPKNIYGDGRAAEKITKIIKKF